MTTHSVTKYDTPQTVRVPKQIKSKNHRKTCGRYITELSNINWWRVAKVTLIAGLLLSTPFIPAIAACAGAYLYRSNSDGMPIRQFRIRPSFNTASSLHNQQPNCLPLEEPSSEWINQFPDYTAAFSKPGMRLVFAGTHGCSIHDGIEPGEVCQDFIKEVLLRPEADQNLDRLKADPGYNGKAINIPIRLKSGRIKSVFFNVNLREYTNYKNALQHIEQTILVNGFGDNIRVSDTLDTLKKINSILMDGLSKNHGQFRTPEVEEKMQCFIREIRNASGKSNDAMELASLVYTRFKDIRPFYKGNDVQALLLLNTALLYYGNYNPVVIYDPQGFKEATNKGQSALANYIRCNLLPWTQGHKTMLN